MVAPDPFKTLLTLALMLAAIYFARDSWKKRPRHWKAWLCFDVGLAAYFFVCLYPAARWLVVGG